MKPSPSDPNKEPTQAPEEEPKNPKEHFYDKIPLTVKQLDVVILVLLGLMLLFVFLGRNA